jgi:glutathione synthase/RimK-type ligase-like ATP-grasp enzyme
VESPDGWAVARHRPSALILNGRDLASAADVEVTCRGIDELAFAIETGRVRIAETVGGRDLADFGLVQVAGYPRPTAALINAIADYLEYHSVCAINVAGIGAPTKLGQYVRFAQAGLPVPDTFYSAPSALAESYSVLADWLDLPFVLKAMSASGGRYNFLVRSERELLRYLRDPDYVRVRFVAQQFIPNDTTLRMLVLGDEVGLIMRRSWAPGTHLANTAQGGASVLVDPADFDPAVKGVAAGAARLINSEVAGVNLIQHWTTGQWYVLDANANPAITTGAFVEEKLAAYQSYLRRRLGLVAQSRAVRRRSDA